jgi:hypothetical protein
MPQTNIPYGARVTIESFPGAVYTTRERDGKQHVGVILDDDVTETLRWFHKDDPALVWHGVVAPGRIFPWQIKPPWIKDFTDPQETFTVYASHFMKARHKGFLELQKYGLVAHADLLEMRVRRGRDDVKTGTVDICASQRLGRADTAAGGV